jgi:hypothetical protein
MTRFLSTAASEHHPSAIANRRFGRSFCTILIIGDKSRMKLGQIERMAALIYNDNAKGSSKSAIGDG